MLKTLNNLNFGGTSSTANLHFSLVVGRGREREQPGVI
jgi:hypothetical protein